VRAYHEAGASRVVLATGPRTPDLESAMAPHRDRVEWVETLEAETDLAPVLTAGLRALGGAEEPLAIGLADMPLLTGALVGDLAARFRASGCPLGVPVCQDQLGHPAFFLPQLRGELSQLRAPATHRNLIFARGAAAATLETPSTAVLRTIDGLPEYREMLRLAGLPAAGAAPAGGGAAERRPGLGGRF
jgi:CTP:molybdopterin cytidylyltransferase MocA